MNWKMLGSCLTDFTLGEIPKGVICLWGEQPGWVVSRSAQWKGSWRYWSYSFVWYPISILLSVQFLLAMVHTLIHCYNSILCTSRRSWCSRNSCAEHQSAIKDFQHLWTSFVYETYCCKLPQMPDWSKQCRKSKVRLQKYQIIPLFSLTLCFTQ